MISFTLKLFNRKYIKSLKNKDFVIESLFTDGFVHEDVASTLKTGNITDAVTHKKEKQVYLDRYSHITNEILKELEEENVIGYINATGKNEQGQSFALNDCMFLKGKGRILYENRELYYTTFERDIQLKIDILRNWVLVIIALASLLFGVIQYRNGNNDANKITELNKDILLISTKLDSIQKFTNQLDSNYLNLKSGVNKLHSFEKESGRNTPNKKK